MTKILVNTEDLATQQMIADYFELKKTTIHQWRQRYPDFPKPVLSIGGQHGRPTNLWSMRQVAYWYANRS